jgi:hypothetical protein
MTGQTYIVVKKANKPRDREVLYICTWAVNLKLPFFLAIYSTERCQLLGYITMQTLYEATFRRNPSPP